MTIQRWRLTFSRTAETANLQPRELTAAWAALIGSIAGDSAERPRLVHAAPLPIGMTADRELSDLLLPQRFTIGTLRDLLRRGMPAGHDLRGLHDVWVGEPSLPSLVVAGDYTVTVAGVDERQRSRVDLEAAVAELLKAPTVSRTRTKGDRTVTDDQRPLILDVRATGSDRLWMRLRIDAILGTGRPEEVVQALGEILGTPLDAQARHRERLWLRDEPGLAPDAI
jgi:hypothetical protein